LILAALLTVWEVLARAGLVSRLFFPPPSVIVSTLASLFGSGTMVAHLALTLRRFILGFVLGAVLGLLLGLVMGRWRRVRAAVDPLVASAHPVPKIAILPLFMVIFGIGDASKVVVIALGAFFPILINTMAGVRQISPVHFEVATNYGARPRQLFTRVLLPGSLPMILAGVRLGVNIALLLTIAVEIVAATGGLGTMVWRAWETLRVEQIYASLAVIAAMGLAFNLVLRGLEQRLVPWQQMPEI
jgi:NitT/TauT family transport system permease protein